MRNKTIAVFSIGLILLAACGREFKSTMSEEEALENLTNVTELSGYSAWGKKKPSKPKPPPVSYVELQALLIKLVQEVSDSLWLKVLADNKKAITVYKSLGFEITEEYSTENGDGVTMVWSRSS